MPSPRDITGDLVRLRNTKPLQGPPPSEDTAAPKRFSDLRMRPMASDPVLWLAALVIIVGLAVQGALILWML